MSFSCSHIFGVLETCLGMRDERFISVFHLVVYTCVLGIIGSSFFLNLCCVGVKLFYEGFSSNKKRVPELLSSTHALIRGSLTYCLFIGISFCCFSLSLFPLCDYNFYFNLIPSYGLIVLSLHVKNIS